MKLFVPAQKVATFVTLRKVPPYTIPSATPPLHEFQTYEPRFKRCKTLFETAHSEK